MASHRLEFGFLDFVGERSLGGSLYFSRNPQGKGHAYLRTGEEGRHVTVSAPTSFVRACDAVADCRRVKRVWGISNRNVRGVIEGRDWHVETAAGIRMAYGTIYRGFTTPHEIVHGLTVCMCFSWLTDDGIVDGLEGEGRDEYKRKTTREEPSKGFTTAWHLGMV